MTRQDFCDRLEDLCAKSERIGMAAETEASVKTIESLTSETRRIIKRLADELQALGIFE